MAQKAEKMLLQINESLGDVIPYGDVNDAIDD